MSSVADIKHNTAYLIICPHPESCQFECVPIDGQHLITQVQWEKITNDDNLREEFKKLSAKKFGKINTIKNG